MNDEEVAFRDILLLKAMRQDGDIMTGYKFRDSSSQAQLVGLYAMQAETIRKDLEKQARANDEVIAMAIGGGTRGQISAVQEVKSLYSLLTHRQVSWHLFAVTFESDLKSCRHTYPLGVFSFYFECLIMFDSFLLRLDLS